TPATTAPATTHPPDAPATSPSAARQLGQSEDDCEDEPEQHGAARERDVALHGTSAGRRRIQGHTELLCECLRDQVYAVRQPGPVFLPREVGRHGVANPAHARIREESLGAATGGGSWIWATSSSAVSCSIAAQDTRGRARREARGP